MEARDGQFGVEDEFGNWSGLVGELHGKVTNFSLRTSFLLEFEFGHCQSTLQPLI